MTRRIKKRHKIISLTFILVCVLYCAILLWLLPVYLKTPINDRLLEQKLQIDYQRLWINPLTLNIHLQETELQNLSGEVIFSAKNIAVDWQLWPVFNRHINIDHLFLKQANIQLEFNQDNQLISPSFEPTTSNATPWQFNPGDLEVINSSVILKRQDQHLKFNDINLHLNLAELIKPQQFSPNQPASIHLNTTPKGDFSIERTADEDFFHWQLNDWPLQDIAAWLSNSQKPIELEGQITALGTFLWPPGQLPVFKITATALALEKLHWPPFKAQQARINARDINLDFNKQHLQVGHLTSPGGELSMQLDPLDLASTTSMSATANGHWQGQLDAMDFTDWTITLQDDRPAVRAVIEQFTINTESSQQKLTVKLKLIAPFDQPVMVTAHGPLNPMFLQGELHAEALNLVAINPWLQELSPWQIQQASLAVNSRFCAQDNAFYAEGDWSIPQLTIIDMMQRIDASQTKLQSIGLDIKQQRLILNNFNSQSIEMRALDNDSNPQQADHAAVAPQSNEQLWHVIVDEGFTGLCALKPNILLKK
ncbi:MAG: DUF748 domain-containing protein [Proteobacteria bacterium]|nr:MAG: DUF748 domain-containing protein [Pseudomonadota bacterium]